MCQASESALPEVADESHSALATRFQRSFKEKIEALCLNRSPLPADDTPTDLTKSPENVAGLVGSDVTLRCAGTDLIWEEYVSNPTGDAVAISSGDRVAKPNKYGLITEPTGTYDLTIKSIELKQGGRYKCKAFLDSTSFTYAQVITFSAFNPTCSSNTTNYFQAVAGDYVEYSCERKYKGNLTPKMKWTDLSTGEDVTAKDESSAGTVKFSIVVEMTPSHNGDRFTFQTYFDKPQSRYRFADNIPINNNAFNERFTLPKQTVY
ncbi:hypothetical protein NP493_2437g00002 [Ridgeia piscesae]|uniref:Ig-like domain-containing protein n=1 Tax=Ridgeia piscesae TaxID=27915 RepID=A0AAD9JG96_RIDPI|nr:hypothetical protein NP493_2437g00002 [Ridgeia piscesae]